ncbi:translocation/assembly module TamB domain-containing protein [Roseivivax sp.]
MRHLTALTLATATGFGLAAPAPLMAQGSDDRGRLEALIEDNLSGEGFNVDIVGFEGALSSVASLEELIISDAEGPWLTLRGVELDWNRAALLRGRVSVEELVAEEILMPRLPQGGEAAEELPEAEAKPFSLPELPVSVEIGRIAAERVELGAPVMGTAAVIALEGSASLAGGEGEVALSVDRLDRGGEISLESSYANESNTLSVDLALNEPEGGIVAGLIGLPGEPALALSVEGEGPLSDFAADLQLATEGQDRLAGRVAVRALEGEAPGTGFTVDLAGDIRPLLSPENRAFFGADLSLAVAGESLESGALNIDTLSLASEAINIDGQIALGPDKWPRLIDLTGDIAGRDGQPIQLPIPGEVTRVDRAELNVQYDAEAGESWRADIRVAGLDRPTLAAEALRLDGDGTLARGDGSAIGRVEGRFDLGAEALAFADPSLAEAVGSTLSGLVRFSYQENEPLRLTEIDLDGAGLALAGALDISGLTDDLNIAIEGALDVETDDIARFSALAGRELSGGARASVEGRVEPISGAFDADLDARVTDLVTGIPEADRLLDGETALSLSARRDEAGILIRALDLSAPEASLEANGRLGGATGNAELALRIAEISEILPELSGPLEFDGTARNAGEDWQISGDLAGPGGAEAVVDAALKLVEGQLTTLGGSLTADVDDLSAYSRIAGRELGGAAELTAEGSADLTETVFSLNASGAVTDPLTGVAEADRLLEGRTRFSVDGTYSEAAILLRELRIAGERITASAEGAYRESDSAFDLDLRLSELGDVLPAMSGAATLRGSARQRGEDWDLTLDADGPGGLVADLDGTARVEDLVPQSVMGELALRVNTLRPYAGLTGQALSGAIEAQASGSYDLTSGAADLTLDADATSLATGIAPVDQLLRGGVTDLSFTGGRTAEGNFRIERLDLDTPQLEANASGTYGAEGGRIDYDLALANLGLFVPDFTGPATARGSAETSGGDWRVDAALTAPGDTRANVSGSLAPDASRVDLDVTGAAPLGLANPFLAPNLVGGTANFDLSVNGAPGLEAVSGLVSTRGAQFTLPAQNLALEDINADIRLGGGRAEIDLRSDVSSGGDIRVTGPVTLSAPFNGDLSVILDDVVAADPGLYQTDLDGRLRLSGPLASTATLSGRVELDQTEVRIPSGGGIQTLDFPIEHRNANPEVRRTLERAGLVERPEEQTQSGGGLNYGLDLVISAPSRIFIRGRGLDAEVGGELRVGGTTQNVVPQGRFELIRGRLDILGQRIELDEATVSLEGDFNPFVRVVALTQSGDTQISVTIEGAASDPEVSFASTPDRPQEEVLALLLFGRDLSEISAFQALRIAAAINTLSGGGPGITETLRANTGLDNLDLQTSEDGSTAVSVGKYIGENAYTDVTVNSTGETEVNLNLEITDSVTARGTVSSTGNTGVGLYYERDY